ncbi:hypothetical protein NQ317_004003 [Molorchus minor]|uniref:Protein FAM32A n=1 Tax=Molorchus minor TaxID=1323400 RepID=A0ABQ9IVZ3_9CUCU|nr:hypothetical protein NQ317_004003 [Molorchus minor]
MGGDDPYAMAAKSKLKLKTDNGVKKNKKKNKKLLEQVTKTVENIVEDHQESQPKQNKTKAEYAFIKQQEKMKMKRILEKASQTHKERVEKFNQHLDSLTEHFDIPKVSWA